MSQDFGYFDEQIGIDAFSLEQLVNVRSFVTNLFSKPGNVSSLVFHHLLDSASNVEIFEIHFYVFIIVDTKIHQQRVSLKEKTK